MAIATKHPHRASGLPRVRRAKRPDPDAGTLLAIYNAVAAKPLSRVGVDRARRSWRALASAVARGRPVAQVQPLNIPGPAGPMTLKVYRPALNTGTCPAFIWFHG